MKSKKKSGTGVVKSHIRGGKPVKSYTRGIGSRIKGSLSRGLAVITGSRDKPENRPKLTVGTKNKLIKSVIRDSNRSGGITSMMSISKLLGDPDFGKKAKKIHKGFRVDTYDSNGRYTGTGNNPKKDRQMFNLRIKGEKRLGKMYPENRTIKKYLANSAFH